MGGTMARRPSAVLPNRAPHPHEGAWSPVVPPERRSEAPPRASGGAFARERQGTGTCAQSPSDGRLDLSGGTCLLEAASRVEGQAAVGDGDGAGRHDRETSEADVRDVLGASPCASAATHAVERPRGGVGEREPTLGGDRVDDDRQARWYAAAPARNGGCEVGARRRAHDGRRGDAVEGRGRGDAAGEYCGRCHGRVVRTMARRAASRQRVPARVPAVDPDAELRHRASTRLRALDGRAQRPRAVRARVCAETRMLERADGVPAA